MIRAIEDVMNKVRATSDHQPVFIRAIQEVYESIEPAVQRHPQVARFVKVADAMTNQGKV